MIYTVTLAIFPAWKAPVPYETLTETFSTATEAAQAGEKSLFPIIERELADIASDLKQWSQQSEQQRGTAIAVPERPVHGYLIFDQERAEVFNWTTLDIAAMRSARD